MISLSKTDAAKEEERGIGLGLGTSGAPSDLIEVRSKFVQVPNTNAGYFRSKYCALVLAQCMLDTLQLQANGFQKDATLHFAP